ncbi:MAG: hypothetical protein ACI89L_002495 [Phycisphaerales bacterium]|jgi:hypothetical protein
MNERPWNENEALVDLLAKDAIEGLTESERAELDRLLAAEDGVDAGAFDDAVAAMDVAIAEADEAGPPAGVLEVLGELADRIEAEPKLRLAGTAAEREPVARRSGLAFGGWVTAAACLMVAAVAWWPSSGPAEPVALTLAQRVEELKARPGVVTVSWVGLDDAGLSQHPHSLDQELRGEVVWDDARDEGYMVFEGLASNDPSAMQYQLWIFDSERRLGDLPHFDPGGLPILTQRPVDGGVFDVANGKVIVPITARLPIGGAAVFAVTSEPPGGVVVSDRDVVTLALVPSVEG